MRKTEPILILLAIGLLEARAADQKLSIMSLNPGPPTETEHTISFDAIGADIPEVNPGGITDSRIVAIDPTLIVTDLNITLEISGTGFGGFNGDLYVTLQHGDRFAVLLNRPGSRTAMPVGYSDSGLSITLDDEAAADIHNYRLTLSGDNSIPIAGPLTGSWQPDARDVDPLLSLDSSPRSAFLSGFDGTSLDGEWSLSISDRSSGGTQRLESWSINATTIPEPNTIALTSVFLTAIFLRKTLRNTHLR